MIFFNKSLAAWNTTLFDKTLFSELDQLDENQLLLQNLLTQSSVALKTDVKFIINRKYEDENHIQVQLGVFFKGVIAGCNCADDPSPIDMLDEYGELLFQISKIDAKTSVQIVDK